MKKKVCDFFLFLRKNLKSRMFRAKVHLTKLKSVKVVWRDATRNSSG